MELSGEARPQIVLLGTKASALAVIGVWRSVVSDQRLERRMAEMLHVGILGAGLAAEDMRLPIANCAMSRSQRYGIVHTLALKRLRESSGIRR